MSKIREALQEAQTRLQAAGIATAQREAQLLLAHLLDCEPTQLLWRFEDKLSDEQQEALQQLVARRSAFYPLQYLLGEQQFMGLDLTVTPAVLIPRWDTECLVEEALRLLADRENPLAADVCCGSGAIGIALAYHLPSVQVFLTDVSTAALTVCRENIARYQLAARVQVLVGDLVEPLAGQQLDLLISNPPYIPQAQLAQLPLDVQREPQLALDGGADGLDFYRRLAVEARAVVRDGGWLLLEMDSTQIEPVGALLIAADWQVDKTLFDLAGRPRGLRAHK